MESNLNGNNAYAYFILSIIANLCQVCDFDINQRQISNNELSKKLDKVIEQNNTIMKLLENKD